VSPGEPAGAEELLGPFDALVLVGGGDVEPRHYGQTPGDHVYGLEPDRDELEIALLHAADRTGVPALCICRGMQVMNVAFGGTLLQHLPALEGLLEHGVPVDDTVSTHDVRVAPGSRLASSTGAEVLSCSSHHHQAVDRVGDGLTATGWSPDGLVEAIEREGEGWILGVQWHPEDTAAEDGSQQALFDALVERIRTSA
jgi:gamma-glutamyl-gamma-aminobutyrate hydrolase PuuD